VLCLSIQKRLLKKLQKSVPKALKFQAELMIAPSTAAAAQHESYITVRLPTIQQANVEGVTPNVEVETQI